MPLIINTGIQMARRKKKAQPFCPRLMYRLDNIKSIPGSPTFWICSICLCFILKQDAVKPHLERCQPNAEKNRAATIERMKKLLLKMARRKKKVQPFCPKLMYRLDNIKSIPGSPTFWICSICLRFILKQDAVKPHLERCQPNAEKNRAATIKWMKKYFLLYTCDKCYQVFNQKKDQEQHIIDKHN